MTKEETKDLEQKPKETVTVRRVRLDDSDFQNLLSIRPSMSKRSTRTLLEYTEKFFDKEDIPIAEEITEDVLKGFSLATTLVTELMVRNGNVEERPSEENVIDDHYWKGFYNGIRTEKFRKGKQQESCDDVMAINTQGLAEGVRCAMCTNSIKSDRGCDGGCMVDDKMYQKVMEVINKQMFELPVSDDCVSRQAVLDNAYAYGNGPEPEGYCVEVVDIQALPPITPVQNWIPVDKELPKEHVCDDGFVDPSEPVLVQLNNKEMKVSRYWGSRERYKDEPWIDLSYPTTLEVVAWMSLPESYEVETEVADEN